jgi:insertion element IS1 protein InsB
MWSFVGKKGNQRWLWHTIDHHTGQVLAYVFGRRKDVIFLQLKALLESFGLTRFYTDHWGAYERHLEPDMHSPGKRNTQKIEGSVANYRKQESSVSQVIDFLTPDFRIWPQKGEFATEPCSDHSRL